MARFYINSIANQKWCLTICRATALAIAVIKRKSNESSNWWWKEMIKLKWKPYRWPFVNETNPKIWPQNSICLIKNCTEMLCWNIPFNFDLSFFCWFWMAFQWQQFHIDSISMWFFNGWISTVFFNKTMKIAFQFRGKLCVFKRLPFLRVAAMVEPTQFFDEYRNSIRAVYQWIGIFLYCRWYSDTFKFDFGYSPFRAAQRHTEINIDLRWSFCFVFTLIQCKQLSVNVFDLEYENGVGMNCVNCSRLYAVRFQ